MYLSQQTNPKLLATSEQGVVHVGAVYVGMVTHVSFETLVFALKDEVT